MLKRSIEANTAAKGGHDCIINSPRNDIYLVLDNIRSMHNVGAIFRTSDAARIKCLYLCGITATPPRTQISKTALNTIDYVPWRYYKSTLRLVNILRKSGIHIVCLEQTDTSVDYRTFNYQKPLAIIVGNEIEGINENILEISDGCIEIPMQGIANSLNVATATGIALFNII